MRALLLLDTIRQRLAATTCFFSPGPTSTARKSSKPRQPPKYSVDPQTFVNQISADFQDMTGKMGVSKTTDPHHSTSPQDIRADWRRIAANGHIYLGHYEGWVRHPRRGLLRRIRAHHPPRRHQDCPLRRPGRLGTGAVLLLRPLQMAGQAPATIRNPPRLHRPHRPPPQRGHQLFVLRRPDDLSISRNATQLHLHTPVSTPRAT